MGYFNHNLSTIRMEDNDLTYELFQGTNYNLCTLIIIPGAAKYYEMWIKKLPIFFLQEVFCMQRISVHSDYMYFGYLIKGKTLGNINSQLRKYFY